MKKYEINALLFSKIISIFIFILLKIILCETDECKREKPIKMGNSCLLDFCSKSQFESGDCIISNSITKTQWLNNIILVGEKNFRYINFMTSSKGKMILYSSPFPIGKERIFFGIDSNAYPIFKDEEGNDAYIIKKNIPRTNYAQYEVVSGSFIFNNDPDLDKEYFMAIGKSYADTEIFDFEKYNEEIMEIPYGDIVKGNTEIVSGNLINFKENDINYYFLTLLRILPSGSYSFLLVKFKINYDSNGEFIINTNESELFNSLNKRIANCYMLDNIIVCMYVSQNKKYKIHFFDADLNSKYENELSIEYNSSSRLFFKWLHFKEKFGVFTYYQGIDNDYPTVQLLETTINESSYSIDLKTDIILNKYYFNNSLMLTDIIKLTENILSLVSTTTEKETLIVVLINFYNDIDYNIRYYLINLFALYKHKFLHEMKLHIYNQNLAFAFSFCHLSLCNKDEDEHYSSLIFFSYPNSTDSNLDVVDYLNNMENNNITINLKNNVHIDNNIFGFILYGIKIYSIDNCGINFISSKTNENIKKDDILDKNENIIFEFINNDYEIVNCSLVYFPIIKAPDIEEYNKYPNYILKSNETEENIYNNILYEGKLGYYNILITQHITKNCEEKSHNCDLCLKNNNLICLSCKYKYQISDEIKICNDSEISTTIFNYDLQTTNENENILIEESDSPQTTLIENIVGKDKTYYIIKNCTIENIVQRKCPNILLTNEELKGVYW